MTTRIFVQSKFFKAEYVFSKENELVYHLKNLVKFFHETKLHEDKALIIEESITNDFIHVTGYARTIKSLEELDYLVNNTVVAYLKQR